MRKIFKFQAGGGEWFPYPTIDNTGASSIMFQTQTSQQLPNYRTAAQQANNTFTGKISQDRDTFRSLMTRGSNPFTEITDDKGVVDYNPSPHTEKEIQPSKFETTMQKVGQVSSAVSSYIPKKPQSGLTTGLDSGFDAATQAVSMFNPIVGSFMAAGGAAVDLMRMAGFGTDQVTFADQVLDSKPLTPLGLINGFTAKKAQNLMGGVDYNNMRADMGAGYGGLSFRLNNAEKYAGKKIGNVFGQRNSANREVYKGNYELSKFEKVYNQGQVYRDIQGTQSDMAFNKENLRMKGGWDDGAISFGRRGMIINPQRMRMIRHITQSYKPQVYTETELSEEEVMQFKNGGSFNLIPEGALHARLHHMENTDGFTKKGIPVVAEKDGGEVEQQAEIELNEIIFRLEVTNEIEKLMNDGSDNAAIECGKMLVKEIFENTDDRTGLIETLEEPKEDQGSVVKEHRVFQKGGEAKPSFEEWYKTVPTDRNDTTFYNLKRAYELEKWEQLEKWRTATPEQLKDNSYHLRTFYFNPEGVGEFVKHRDHPTIGGELQFYFGDDGKEFRSKYSLDTTGEYYKYVPRK